MLVKRTEVRASSSGSPLSRAKLSGIAAASTSDATCFSLCAMPRVHERVRVRRRGSNLRPILAPDVRRYSRKTALTDGISSVSIGRRIAQARKEASLSQQAVADRFGISRAAVAQWESGDTHPGMTKLEGLAQALDVQLEWLATGKGAKHAGDASTIVFENQRAAPLLSWAASTAWPDHANPPGGTHAPLVTRAATGIRAFALAIEDESMSPEFAPGDHVIVDPDVIPQAGDFVVARAADDDGPALRLYRALDRHDAGAAELVPLNAAWPTRQINGLQPGRIVGTMVEHRRYRRS